MDHEKLVSGVSAPARYLGLEAGQVIKDPALVRLNLALVFPEIYEIGMSHLGLKLLYDALADEPTVSAERVFMPWVDLMERLDKQNQAPWSQETGRPLNEFDAIGFSLAYELTYTNMLHMLRLSGIPLRRNERGREHPIIIAGGTSMVNPEPVADFLDLAVVGEADELIRPLCELLIQAKEEAWSRERLYDLASGMPGIYAPALFEPVYKDGRLVTMNSKKPGRRVVRKAVVNELQALQPPRRWVIPALKPVHDRLGLEVARGCTRGCRFCQAGYIYRPVRERSAQTLYESALAGLDSTGFEELALLSLSTGDYSCVEELAAALMDALSQEKVSLSLPSLRVDSLTGGLAAQIKRVRKTGFTIAPEAGSQRMRDVINKCLSEEQIVSTAGTVFKLGWKLIKLYFMQGLPTETDADLVAMAELARKVAQAAGGKGRGGKKPLVNASVGTFVPKPHTPFQWDAQLGLDEAWRRLDLIKANLGDRRVRLKWNAPEVSVLEGVLSRGDRRLSRVLELAVKAGCRFDGWSEQLDLPAWLGALEDAGLSLDEYLGPRDPDGILPWDHISLGVEKEFLLAERKRALEGRATGDCRNGACQGCGVCDFKALKPQTMEGEEFRPKTRLPMPEGERTTYRFRLSKTGPARHWGHLEMISQLVRAFKRAGVGLAHSQGFHPHPLLKLASALPLGLESMAEELEVSLITGPHPDTLARQVNPVLPPGLQIADGRFRRPGEKLSEPDQVTYLVRTETDLDPEAIERFKEAEQVEFIRVTPKGGKTLDLKRNILDLELTGDGLRLSVGKEGGRPKPEEVLQAVFGLSKEEAEQGRALKISLKRF